MKSEQRWVAPKDVEEEYHHADGAKLNAAVRECRRSGKEVLAFLGSDPPAEGFVNKPMSDMLAEAAKMSTEKYPGGTTLIRDLKAGISSFEKKYRNIDCPPERIILGPGVAACWATLQYALLSNDEVVVFDPTHYLTKPMSYIHIFGSKAVSCRTIESEGWKPDIDDLRAKITDKTRAIIFGNPNNPTGSVWDEKMLKQIVDVAGEHKLPLVVDEIYGLITYEVTQSPSIVSVAKDVPAVMFSGMSKFFMRPGWRLGYMCFNNANGADKLIATSKKVAGTYGHAEKSLPSPILYAAAKAYQDAENSYKAGKEMVKETAKHRDYVLQRLSKIEGVKCVRPEGALYAFPRIGAIGKTWQTDLEFILELLKEEGVAWYMGSEFGKFGFGHMRILLQPKMERLEAGLNKLERFLSKHN